ncbi:MAG: nucleotide sugar dehydrogenase [Deltaproteobacteria bacterium]|nr:nucleotide sugar dehydrogenase [Deltaproteobacteria bacterium]
MKEILKKIKNRSIVIGVIGLGYVGLPLCNVFLKNKVRVIGFDIDKEKIDLLKKGKIYIKHLQNISIKEYVDEGRFVPTNDFSKIKMVDHVAICVPTPLNKNREPDISFIRNTVKSIIPYLHEDMCISLESTTYPGTTVEEIVVPLETLGYKVGKEIFVAFSPEREDPGNKTFHTADIPKVVGGHTKNCTLVASKVYEIGFHKVVVVSDTRVAEMTKILENTYRGVNIALVNELKIVCQKMGIDIWEVIKAASTKPFGFQPFYPGPGLGGHCIPIDPFYLTWKAREFEVATRFIELSGEINTSMPYYVVEKTAEVLNFYQKPLNGSKILILGVAYKKDIDDMRESPAIRIIEILKDKGAKVFYHDDFFPVFPKLRAHKINMKSSKLSKRFLNSLDAAIITTDHSHLDYEFIAKNVRILIDTRNATDKFRHKYKNIYMA